MAKISFGSFADLLVYICMCTYGDFYFLHIQNLNVCFMYSIYFYSWAQLFFASDRLPSNFSCERVSRDIHRLWFWQCCSFHPHLFVVYIYVLPIRVLVHYLYVNEDLWPSGVQHTQDNFRLQPGIAETFTTTGILMTWIPNQPTTIVRGDL